MTTKISTIYDDLRTMMSTLFTSHREINNINDLNADAEIMYDRAWGILISPAQNTNRSLGCGSASIARAITITFVRNLRLSNRDIATRIATEKLLLEDEITLIKHIEKNPTTSSVAKLVFVSDNGFSYKDADRFGYVRIDVTLGIEYFEQL